VTSHRLPREITCSTGTPAQRHAPKHAGRLREPGLQPRIIPPLRLHFKPIKLLAANLVNAILLWSPCGVSVRDAIVLLLVLLSVTRANTGHEACSLLTRNKLEIRVCILHDVKLKSVGI
jgi:hypothetical protein